MECHCVRRRALILASSIVGARESIVESSRDRTAARNSFSLATGGVLAAKKMAASSPAAVNHFRGFEIKGNSKEGRSKESQQLGRAAWLAGRRAPAKALERNRTSIRRPLSFHRRRRLPPELQLQLQLQPQLRLWLGHIRGRLESAND